MTYTEFINNLSICNYDNIKNFRKVVSELNKKYAEFIGKEVIAENGIYEPCEGVFMGIKGGHTKKDWYIIINFDNDNDEDVPEEIALRRPGSAYFWNEMIGNLKITLKK